MYKDSADKMSPKQNELPGYCGNELALSNLLKELKLLEVDACDQRISVVRTANLLKVLELKLHIIRMQGDFDGH